MFDLTASSHRALLKMDELLYQDEYQTSRLFQIIE